MDPRWQPPLEHPPVAEPPREAHELLAAGWRSAVAESRLAAPGSARAALIAPQTWHSLRQLHARLPCRLRMQLR